MVGSFPRRQRALLRGKIPAELAAMPHAIAASVCDRGLGPRPRTGGQPSRGRILAHSSRSTDPGRGD